MMCHRMNIILALMVTCSLMLNVQHSILAQVKAKQESPRAMIQRLQQEIEELQDKIAENPSSSKVGEMKSKIQWNMRKIKEITPHIVKQTEPKIKAEGNKKGEGTQISGVDRYRAIIQNNLFMPLGSGDEVKREELVLIGTMGRSALIQTEGSDKSFYVTEGQSFGNGAKLVRVGENSVTIVHEGSEKELELASVASISQSIGSRDGKTKQQQGSFDKNNKGMKTAYRGGKEGRDGGEKKGGNTNWAREMSMDELNKAREDIERYIEGLAEKGVTDPKLYESAYKKMETVVGAMAEKEYSDQK